MPNALSGLSSLNPYPGLAVGMNSNYGKVFACTPGGFMLFGTNFGESAWNISASVPGTRVDMAWSSGGLLYRARQATPFQVFVEVATNPAAPSFNPIPGGNFSRPYPGLTLGSVKVRNVNGIDHIYVTYNDLSRSTENASVFFSVNGGATWVDTQFEYTALRHLAPVRLDLSSDGQTVYAAFASASSFNNAADATGDYVVLRDDDYGTGGFGALGPGTVVTSNITLPYLGTTLGGERLLGNICDIAVDPNNPSRVYFAYTLVSNNVPVLVLNQSLDAGVTWSPVFTRENASLPAVAVSGDGTVGALFDIEHVPFDYFDMMLVGPHGQTVLLQRTLARFPDNQPPPQSGLWLGSPQLVSQPFGFIAGWCAPNNPDPAAFPSGAYFQRNVMIGSTVYSNFYLTHPGSLVNGAGGSVSPSMDLFSLHVYNYFPPGVSQTSGNPPCPHLLLKPAGNYGPTDPLVVSHLCWPFAPSNEPPNVLQESFDLVNWYLATNRTIIQTNGQNEAPFFGINPEDYVFFRLQQDSLAGSQFSILAASGLGGSVVPNGNLTVDAFADVNFTAPASNNFSPVWWLDGVEVQLGVSSLTLSNVTADHTVTATFVPSNDVAVTVFEIPFSRVELSYPLTPTLTQTTNKYVVDVANTGLNSLTGVSMTDSLPSTVTFVAASTTQGSVTNTNSTVSANIGSLNAGDTARVTIWFATGPTAGSITNIATVSCDQPEPVLSNNTATDFRSVLVPVTITNVPTSQSVAAGSTVSFTVGASGTTPFLYQWFLNGTNLLNGGAGATLTLTNVTAAQAGSYSVAVLQVRGLDVVGTNSPSATLMVH